MTSQEHGTPTGSTEANLPDWDPSEWEAVRDDANPVPAEAVTSVTTPPLPVTSPPEAVLTETAPTTTQPHAPVENVAPIDGPETVAEELTPPAHSDIAPESPQAPRPVTPLTIDLSDIPQAQHFVAHNRIDTVENAFTLANILHTDRHVQKAAEAYKIAIDLHSGSPHHHPTIQVLLQVRLLCILKAGLPLPPEEIEQLRGLNRPFANYIEGLVTSWRERDHRAALLKIGSAFHEFHTGEEIDSLTLEIARQITPSLFEQPRRDMNPRRIPRNLFMYWDKNPPEEIRRNFDYHRNLEGFNVKIFDREEAILWLYKNYGTEARNIFTNLRHPAEAADFLRAHVTQLLGGWWLDADLRIRNPEVLDRLASQTAQNVFFVTANHVVHNDFYGTIPNSAVTDDVLLSLYRNCYLFHHLFIAYKTGPGPFTRALNRTALRAFKGVPPQETTRIYNQTDFNEFVEEFDTPYKHVLPNWQNV